MQAAATALEGVFGEPPHFTREGGSIPIVADFKKILGLDTVLMGFGLDSDSIHSPNERFGLGPVPPGHRGLDPVHGRVCQAVDVTGAAKGEGRRAGGRCLPLALCLFPLALIACTAEPNAPAVTPSSDTLAVPVVLEVVLDSLGLEAEVLDAEGQAYAMIALPGVTLQWANTRDVVLNHVLGPVVGSGIAKSHFHPTASSPAFGMMPPGTVTRQQYADPRLLLVMNGAFFETPGEPSTQLAFPISENGTVVSGGSSPAGPGQPGADLRRWGQPLRALALDGDAAQVADYIPDTGAPDRPRPVRRVGRELRAERTPDTHAQPVPHPRPHRGRLVWDFENAADRDERRDGAHRLALVVDGAAGRRTGTPDRPRWRSVGLRVEPESRHAGPADGCRWPRSRSTSPTS